MVNHHRRIVIKSIITEELKILRRIEITELYKTTSEHFRLNIEQLDLYSDTIYGLIGPNGSGKTTLLKCICGLLIPDSGTINYTDDLSQAPAMIDLGMIGTNFIDLDGLNSLSLDEIYWDQVVYHHLLDPPLLQELLNDVALNVSGTLIFRKMSLGMKQRFMLGISLLSDPQIILLDEPFNGLDPDGVQLFIECLKSQINDRIIVISSHGLEDLETFIHSVIFIENGEPREPLLLETIKNKGMGGLRDYYDKQKSSQG